jgi:hypothetical protein
MKVRHIRRMPSEIPLKCKAEVEYATQLYRIRWGRGFECEKMARYHIDGKPMCALHAGRIVLNHIVDNLKGDIP